jgi:transcription-repair coupling factor
LDSSNIQKYRASGSFLTRALFCQTLLKNPKNLFLFETSSEVKKAKKTLEYGLKFPLIDIATTSDALAFFAASTGNYIGTIAMFGANIRYEYLKKKQTFTLQRWDIKSPRECIESLSNLGFCYEADAYSPYTYCLVGSELHIQDRHTKMQVSFFGDEIDDITLQNDTKNNQFFDATIQSKICRVESRIVYTKNSPAFPEENTDIQPIETGASAFTFDLDFFEKKEKLSENFIQTIAFLSEWEDIWFLPIQFDDLEDFSKYIQGYTGKICIHTHFPKPIQTFLSDNWNFWKEIEVIECPKLTIESVASETIAHIGDDCIGKLFVQKRTKKQTMRALDLLMTLKPGDYVVHQDHGIGRFGEILEKEVSGAKREYASIRYAGDDVLYVPVTELYRITKYLGEENPTLHKLGGATWKKTLNETEAEILKTAEELLEMYAKRKLARGYAFQKHAEAENAFRDAFTYSHTEDQKSAIEMIASYMEEPIPMDMLLCWDVGFWKTEVAMNAAFKAVNSWKQVAVISPLVVLTLEHADSFAKRFLGAKRTNWKKEIRIEILSRLSTQKEAKKILEGLGNGEIDIVIGTHRLLGDDIRFANLGLLIVDEEHRFGVIDKEKIKKLRAGIDVLSLSATPIPRSLNLALSGMRQLCMLTTPPPSRKSIITRVIGWNEAAIRSAIEAELERDGQVIFLHNRVASLQGVANELQGMLGKKLTPLLLHGQMPSHQIEDTLLSFRAQKANCLITTTVIENGVNFLEANTIIIDHADEFWLAQLHQLRGRVGRKDREAHCILTYRKPFLPEDGKKRLLAIIEHSHLWAGFEIAMRDLEIRGAGEILGIAQSGKTKETGMSLYVKLLETKMEELQTGKKSGTPEVSIELDIGFVIPESFFTSDIDKIQFYRNLEWIEEFEELMGVKKSFFAIHGESEDLEKLFLILEARFLLFPYKIRTVKKVLKDYVFDFIGAVPQDIRNFLSLDPEENITVQSIERVRVAKNIFTSDFDFLKKIVSLARNGNQK